MTLNQWFLSSPRNQIDFIRKYIKINPPIPDITHLAFIDIKQTIPEHFNCGEFEQAIAIALSTSPKNILAKTEQERFELLIWLEGEYDKINKVEQKYLTRQPDIKQIAAGIRNLDILGVTNVVDMLAGGDVTKWEQVKRLPYSVCFEKQLKNVLESDIQKKLIEQNKPQGKK